MVCLSGKSLILHLTLVITLCLEFLEADRECAARPILGNSVVCVCNATYCDSISRIHPHPEEYVTYTSSEAGLRFKKSIGKLIPYKKQLRCATVLALNPKVLYQKISGFGGAVTDATGINWKSLKDHRTRQHLIDSYFSKAGIEYSMVRVPMGGTDFSTRPYAYNEMPRGDKFLSNFTLTTEDYNLKIPFIQAAMKVSTQPIRPIGSMWSPPPWMKDSNSFIKGYLKKEYYQTLAEYFIKFMEHYKKCNITFWAVTTTNEPSNFILVPNRFNRMQWTSKELGQWIQNNLGPTIKNSTFRHVNIIVGDDQRFTIPMWFNSLLKLTPGANEYIDGVGVHFYFDKFTPADQLTYAMRDHPDKFIIYTEASIGAEQEVNVDLGSWSRAENYASNIIEDLNYEVIGWIDWNMCLDESGGPNWANNLIDAPVIVSSGGHEFYKQPMFYALGHFSKFLPRGSRRLHVDVKQTCLHDQPHCLHSVPALLQVAFLTPERSVVVVIMNRGEKREVLIKLGEKSAKIHVEAKSFVTVELSHHNTTSC